MTHNVFDGFKGKVLLMLCNRLHADSCIVTVTAQESACNLLHSIKRTLFKGTSIKLMKLDLGRFLKRPDIKQENLD